MPDVFFMFDASRQSLVFGTPQGPMAIHVDKLREAGWDVNEADLRKSLPRFDASSIQVVPGLPPELAKRR